MLKLRQNHERFMHNLFCGLHYALPIAHVNVFTRQQTRMPVAAKSRKGKAAVNDEAIACHCLLH